MRATARIWHWVVLVGVVAFLVTYSLNSYLNVAFYWTFLPVPHFSMAQWAVIDLAASVSFLIIILDYVRLRRAGEEEE